MKGKIVVVTGASRGIGNAIAAAFVDAGATVIIIGRSAESLEKAAKELEAKAIVCDVTQPESVEAAFKQAGHVDILVNNAGNAESASFQNTDLALWNRMLNLNLTGAYLCTKAVIGGMLQQNYGRIINIASTASLKGYPYVSAYVAAKHGLLGLTRSLAAEYAKKGITVNAVCPAYTDTPMIADSLASIQQKTGRSEKEALDALLKSNPMGRLIQPEEVAQAVLYLTMPYADSITGQSITIAGGEI